MNTTPNELLQIAQRHHRAGRRDDAEQMYRQTLDVQPDNPDALHLLGLIALEKGKPSVASDLITESLRVRPNDAAAWGNLGVALSESGRLEEAAGSYRQAIALNGSRPESYSNLGNLLWRLGRLDEAADAYCRALALAPTAIVYRHLGDVLHEQHKMSESIAAYTGSISLDPTDATAFYHMGNSQFAMGLLDDAVASYRHADRLKPGHADACRNMGTALHSQGRLDEAIASYERAMSLQPDNPAFHSDRVFCVHYHPDYTAERIYREQRRWNERHAARLLQTASPHSNTPDPQRQIRIGYVSPDFTRHAMSRFLLPVIEHHNRDAFHITCYSSVRVADTATARFRDIADVWRDVRELSDEQLAQQIRRDQIDILIDLSMHTAHHRLMTFAREPAPLGVTWLACPGGTGMDAMDYRISDPYLDPPGLDDAFYAEKLLRMPDCWCCYQPPADTPPVNGLPALSTGFVTFGCLNNFCKVSQLALVTWARIMREVPQSRLILHAHPGSHRLDVTNLLKREGVEPARVLFAPYRPEAEFLRLHHEIDLALDPFPYAGGTTSCSALWMGVPVVTLNGRTAAGRGTATLLHNVGLAELVADSHDAYVRLAAELARDLLRLSQLRTGVRARMKASPLMDAPRFVQNLEAHYREIWARSCANIR